MSGYITVKDKYEGEGKNQSFWVKTFRNAFTYSVIGDYVELMIWNAEDGEFSKVDDDYETESMKYLKDGTKCYRIAPDNNAKMWDETINGQKSLAIESKLYSYDNPALIKIGFDFYLVKRFKLANRTDKDKSKFCKTLVEYCVFMLGDANDRNVAEYYWNFDDDAIDTSYERYSIVNSLVDIHSLPFVLSYQSHGCRIDKYKEEDSSYVVDRYF